MGIALWFLFIKQNDPVSTFIIVERFRNVYRKKLVPDIIQKCVENNYLQNNKIKMKQKNVFFVAFCCICAMLSLGVEAWIVNSLLLQSEETP